jgi:hypothetical protein
MATTPPPKPAGRSKGHPATSCCTPGRIHPRPPGRSLIRRTRHQRARDPDPYPGTSQTSSAFPPTLGSLALSPGGSSQLVAPPSPAVQRLASPVGARQAIPLRGSLRSALSGWT